MSVPRALSSMPEYACNSNDFVTSESLSAFRRKAGASRAKNYVFGPSGKVAATYCFNASIIAGESPYAPAKRSGIAQRIHENVSTLSPKRDKA